jgi:hypothetical protein
VLYIQTTLFFVILFLVYTEEEEEEEEEEHTFPLQDSRRIHGVMSWSSPPTIHTRSDNRIDSEKKDKEKKNTSTMSEKQPINSPTGSFIPIFPY